MKNHKKAAIWLTIFFFFITSFPRISSAQGVTIDDDTLKQVYQYVEEQFTNKDILGGSYGIIYNGEVIEAKGIGVTDLETEEKVTPTTLYPIASVTKPFTAMGILYLYNQGMLDLKDTVTTYLPWFQYADVEKSSQITIENLLTHSSGVNRFEADGAIYQNEKQNRASLESSIRALSSVEMESNPGEQGEYCNTCYTTLGHIIEKVTGQPYEEYIEETVFSTLGMGHTTFTPEENHDDLASEYSWFFGQQSKTERNYAVFGKSQQSEGGAYSNIEDISKFVTRLVDTNSANIVPPDLLQYAHENGVPLASNEKRFYTLSGFESEDFLEHKTLYKGGDGIGSTSGILLFPEEKLGIVLLIGEAESEVKQPLLQGIASILLGERPEPIDLTWSLWKILGFIALGILGIALILLFLLSFSLRKNIKRKFVLKRKWPYMVGGVLYLLLAIFLGYFLLTMRPSQVGFFGFPWDFAISVMVLIFTFFLWSITLFFSLFEHVKRHKMNISI
ncbi:serine hydrolase [Fredinandcohnia humi]